MKVRDAHSGLLVVRTFSLFMIATTVSEPIAALISMIVCKVFMMVPYS
jgi:hypothetical protein